MKKILFLKLFLSFQFIFLTNTYALVNIENHLVKSITKRESLKSFSSLNPKEVNPSLIKIITSQKKSEELRFAALTVYININQEKASRDILIKALNDKSWLIRNTAIRKITQFKLKNYNQEILSKLKDPSLIVRASAMQAAQSFKLPLPERPF
jgi:HEAT repeat protein